MLSVRPEGVVWSSAGDEGVILDMESSAYLGLNDTAMFLWERLLAGATVESLTADLLREYDVTQEQAHGEVSSFVADLRRRNLVEES